MFRKFIFPILVLELAISACSIQKASPTSTPVAIIDTPVPSTTGTLIPSPTLTETPPSVSYTPSPVPSSVPELSVDILRNATYTTPYFLRNVKLVNGSYSEGSGATYYSVRMLDLYAYGDMNGDGKVDAAVVLAENQGGSGVFESVVAVTDQGGIPHQAGQAQLGDRVLVKSVDISSGVIHLDLVVQGPTDPMCCPSLPQKQNYWLIGSRLWLMRLATTIAGTEHLINVETPANWASVANPFKVSGSMTVLPFENTLTYHIYKIDGIKVNESPFTVTPSGGLAGTFSHDFNLGSAGITDWVIIQFVDVSAADGSTIALGSVILKAH
jgi:hypothetical protein